MAPSEGNPKQSACLVLDLTPWIPDARIGFQSPSVELGVWNPIISGIPDFLSCIPDSKTQESTFHK